jgi:hypothetical protein
LMCGRIGFDAALGDKRIIPTGDMAIAQGPRSLDRPLGSRETPEKLAANPNRG